MFQAWFIGAGDVRINKTWTLSSRSSWFSGGEGQTRNYNTVNAI